MRALIFSSFYREPGRRDKLRALAGLGWEVVATTPGGEAATDAGVRMTPIAVRGDLDDPTTLRWNRGAVKRLLSEYRPDVVQIEEDPETPLADLVATASGSTDDDGDDISYSFAWYRDGALQGSLTSDTVAASLTTRARSAS